LQRQFSGNGGQEKEPNLIHFGANSLLILDVTGLVRNKLFDEFRQCNFFSVTKTTEERMQRKLEAMLIYFIAFMTRYKKKL